MVKPLSFKGDKKPKKRKRAEAEPSTDAASAAEQLQVEADPDNDDSWVSADAPSDISGPVLLVLPTTPPSALACDANGKVFSVPVENIVDGNPASAEPHDVRQVWIANTVAGTEHFRFKGSHGKYLSCDKHGLFTATSTAISPLESFSIIPTPDTPGAFQIQTLRDTFLSVSESGKTVDVRGDATDITFGSTLRIRMQARFKPRLKANKEEKAREKISRKELEEAVGRRLDEGEVKRLKRARREGDYHEQLLVLKVKGKHDKYG